MFKKEIILGILCLFAACHSNDEIIKSKSPLKMNNKSPRHVLISFFLMKNKLCQNQLMILHFSYSNKYVFQKIEKQIYSYHLSVYLFVFLCQQMEQMETRLLK